MIDGWAIMNLRAIKGRAYPRVIGPSGSPAGSSSRSCSRCSDIAAFVYCLPVHGRREELIGYVVLGGAMTAFWLNVLWSMAAQFYWEKETGNLRAVHDRPHVQDVRPGRHGPRGHASSPRSGPSPPRPRRVHIQHVQIDVIDPLMLIGGGLRRHARRPLWHGHDVRLALHAVRGGRRTTCRTS